MNTINNPADLASRGMKAEPFLHDTTWLSGPEFLTQPETDWPVNPENLQKLPHEDPENKVSASFSVSPVQDDDHPLVVFIHRASSWTRLDRVMGWILRFKTLVLHHRRGGKDVLKKSPVYKRQRMSNKALSHIFKLNPVLMDDVLHVGGRLSRAVMSEILNIL